MKYIHRLALGSFMICASLQSMAVTPGQVRFINEATDTTKITSILIKLADMGYPEASISAKTATDMLLGASYAKDLLEGTDEMLTVSMDSFDCMTFVETVTALALTSNERRSSWHDFIYNLERLRYRNGAIDGYGSRLHYVSDWIIDNVHRGNLEDVTARVGNASYKVKTINYMSSNRDKYPKLKDDAEFERIKNLEIGYRSHRLPYLKPGNISRAALRDGDIVAFMSNKQGLDVSHMGIVEMVDGVPMFVHASSKEGKVVLDRLPLADYAQRTKDCYGIRVIRIKE